MDVKDVLSCIASTVVTGYTIWKWQSEYRQQRKERPKEKRRKRKPKSVHK